MGDVATERQDNIDIRSMSDEDLDKYSQELGPTDEESAKEETETDEDVTGKDAGEEEKTGNEEGEKAEGDDDDIEKLKARLAELTESNEKLKKHSDEQAKFEQVRSTELGSLRKQLEILRAQRGITDEQIADAALNDPAAARRLMLAEQEREDAIRDTQSRIAQTEVSGQIKNMHPDFDNILPDIERIIEEDDPGYVARFRQNPYELPPDVLHNLAVRAKQARTIEKLEVELEIERRERKRAASDTIDKVDKAAKAKTHMGAEGSKGKPAAKQYDRATLAKMSDSELDEYLKELDAAD